MWENIYTRETISDYKYLKLFNTEKRKWRKVNTNSDTSLFSETPTPDTNSWVNSNDSLSNDNNSWSSDNSSNSTDFGGGDFGGGGAGGDW